MKPGPLSTPWQSGIWLGHKQCEDCDPPAIYIGCIAKDKCNTTRQCGSPASERAAAVSNGGTSICARSTTDASPSYACVRSLLGRIVAHLRVDCCHLPLPPPLLPPSPSTPWLCPSHVPACSAAVDGYSHVDPKCYESSRTAELYHELLAQGTEVCAVSCIL